MESWFQLPPSGSDRLGILRERTEKEKFINKDKDIKLHVNPFISPLH